MSCHESFQNPNSYRGKKEDSTGKEENIKIISYRNNKTLLSCTPLPGIIWGGFIKATYTGILLSPTALEKILNYPMEAHYPV